MTGENEERAIKVEIDLGNVLIGIGLIGIGFSIVGLADYLSKRKLVEEYVKEAEIYNKVLAEAYESGNFDDYKPFLTNLQNSLSIKERAIRNAGLLNQLIKALEVAFVGFAVLKGLDITSQLIRYLIRRYRPPGYKCPICGKKFDTEDELRDHLVHDHHATTDASKYGALIDDLAQTPEWFKGLVAGALGWTIDQIENIQAWWDSLPEDEKLKIGIAIAIVVLIIMAFAGWFGYIPIIARVFSRALACIT